jgi:hypothetical protein
VASTYLVVSLMRGWRGLDQIPSDPGYNWIQDRVSGGWSILRFSPYLHMDAPLIASLLSSLPRELHGLAGTLISHVIWMISALVVFCVLRHRNFGAIASFVGGLLLITTPWAAQSAIGNYGNVRWPILVAATVVISAEVSYKQPRILIMFLAATAATLTNPVHPVLLMPLLMGVVWLKPAFRKTLVVAASPLVVGLITNLANSDAGGHDKKIRTFWDQAGLFWTSGQLFPVALALIGVTVSARSFQRWTDRRTFSVSLFVVVIMTAAASYWLGGIADRYYVAPAALAAIGALVWLTDFRQHSVAVANVFAVLLSVVLVVPTARWFFVFPYLRSSQAWSTQVEKAREQCSARVISVVELVTSGGDSKTDPIPCDELLQQ